MISLLSSKITNVHIYPAAEMYSSIPLSDYSRKMHTLIDNIFETWPETILPLKSCSSKDMTRYVNSALESAGALMSDIDVTARIHLTTEDSYIQILAEDDLGIVDIEIRVDIDRVNKNIKRVVNILARDIEGGCKFLPGGFVYNLTDPVSKLEPGFESEIITVRKNRLLRPSQQSKDVLDFYYGVHKIKGVDYDRV